MKNNLINYYIMITQSQNKTAPSQASPSELRIFPPKQVLHTLSALQDSQSMTVQAETQDKLPAYQFDTNY